ncbi:MAG: 3-hydroxyacyl-CoA dehydrogenase family protein [Lacrimispora sp.]
MENGVKPRLVGIVGTGLMGASLATLFVGNGIEVVMLGVSDELIGKGVETSKEYFSNLLKAGLVTAKQIEVCMSKLRTTKSYEDLKDCDFIIEAVVERLPVKYEVYKEIEKNCSEDCIITSVTSALSVEDLQKGVVHPERFLVSHPWNPPHLVPCIEVVKGEKTSEETLNTTIGFFKAVKREVVVVRKSVPGFIGNRLMHAMFREATWLVENGVATPEDIDRTLMYSFGPRYSKIGIFEHNDFVGLDLVKNISEYLYPDLCSGQVPANKLVELNSSNQIGYKSESKKGYLDWNHKDMADFRKRQEQPYLQFFNWDLPEVAD